MFYAWRACLLFAVVGMIGALGGCREKPQMNKSTLPGAKQASLPRQMITPSGLEMVLIPEGEFMMGSAAEIDARPVHRVSVGGFYMGKYEVTQELYESIVGRNPARNKGKRNPVERVTWLDAIKFCNALSAKERLRPCYDLNTRQCDFASNGYRLPTEAEWEYACRAGTKGDYSFGEKETDLPAYAWFKGNSAGGSHPVGQKGPNSFGLYDMAGNVREWCNDWYQVDAYKEFSQAVSSDPRGPAGGGKKVLRGGAWSVKPKSCTSWARYCEDPGFTDACLVNDDCGFRCVRRPG
jgi:formylglycine-generating enzyme required for sulfatase activity